MAIAAGTKLGPFEIVAPLGAGGMGEVYRARDTRLDRTVAIKILPSHLSQKAEAKERFERHALATALVKLKVDAKTVQGMLRPPRARIGRLVEWTEPMRRDSQDD